MLVVTHLQTHGRHIYLYIITVVHLYQVYNIIKREESVERANALSSMCAESHLLRIHCSMQASLNKYTERCSDYWHSNCVTLRIHSTLGIGAFNTLFPSMMTLYIILASVCMTY